MRSQRKKTKFSNNPTKWLWVGAAAAVLIPVVSFALSNLLKPDKEIDVTTWLVDNEYSHIAVRVNDEGAITSCKEERYLADNNGEKTKSLSVTSVEGKNLTAREAGKGGKTAYNFGGPVTKQNYRKTRLDWLCGRVAEGLPVSRDEIRFGSRPPQLDNN